MTSQNDNLKNQISIKIAGVGGAGGNAVSYMARENLAGVTFSAINTDARALEALTLSESLVLGASRTRGLGAGGDPDLARSAAQDDLARLTPIFAGADVVIITAGLGGGTGTGASPVIAQAARESGALVLGIVTLPFDFEGSRRQRQAQFGLEQLKAAADAVICLPNQKLFKLIDDNTSVLDTFNISNDLLAQGVRGIWRLLVQTGLINVDFADLCSVTRGRHTESALATAEAGGENRGAQLLDKLLNHPLLDGGQALSDADNVLVSIAGGSDLTMMEINRLMEQLGRHCERAHITMGAAIDESFSGRLAVTLIASRGASGSRPMMASEHVRGGGSPGVDDDASFFPQETPRAASRFVPPPPAMTEENKEKLLHRQSGGRQRRRGNSPRQTTLNLEIVSKGRFEKSEPTIHHGEDLDVPTYIRRGVALN